MAQYTRLTYGAKGDDVKKLQTILNNKGYYNATIDGSWGDKTDAAVRKYQQDKGLKVDGIVADITWGSLLGNNSSSSSASSTIATPSPNTTLAPTDYKESDTVKAAESALNAHLSKKPLEYNPSKSPWAGQLNDTLKKILNREEFEYDLDGDALYQQYKDQYIQQGKLAMQDTMGQAAAMTGGYGNSYAQSVGQQAYLAQIENLNDIIPDLQDAAYKRYLQEGDDLRDQYAFLLDRENTDYERYQDELNAYLDERDYLANRYDTERNYDYSKYVNDRELADESLVTPGNTQTGGQGESSGSDSEKYTVSDVYNIVRESIALGTPKEEIREAVIDARNRKYISEEKYNQIIEEFGLYPSPVG